MKPGLHITSNIRGTGGRFSGGTAFVRSVLVGLSSAGVIRWKQSSIRQIRRLSLAAATRIFMVYFGLMRVVGASWAGVDQRMIDRKTRITLTPQDAYTCMSSYIPSRRGSVTTARDTWMSANIADRLRAGHISCRHTCPSAVTSLHSQSAAPPHPRAPDAESPACDSMQSNGISLCVAQRARRGATACACAAGHGQGW